MEKAILRTLGYHDLFDYPLTLEELHRFLIGKKASLKAVQSIVNGNDFYFLKDREETVKIRKRREKISRKKLKIAQRAAGWLRYLPTIKMVALTGALAVKNSKKDDDIDFLIVTGKDRLWLTRIQAVLLIELLGWRRRPGEREVTNKICLNIFLDEGHLCLPKSKRNLFTAHEICQMRVLWQKDNLYQKFLTQNQWFKKFLPNWKR